MGKAGRQRKHGSKMAAKRAMKAAKRTKYASLAGTSNKTKRQKNKNSGPTWAKHAHLTSNCGNPGCQRCFPRTGPIVSLSESLKKRAEELA